MTSAAEKPKPKTVGLREDRKVPLTEEEYSALMRELRSASGGPLLRFRKAAPFRFRYSYFLRLMPDGPNVAIATMRMLERNGYTRRLTQDKHQPGFETYVLTGKGL